MDAIKMALAKVDGERAARAARAARFAERVLEVSAQLPQVGYLGAKAAAALLRAGYQPSLLQDSVVSEFWADRNEVYRSLWIRTPAKCFRVSWGGELWDYDYHWNVQTVERATVESVLAARDAGESLVEYA